MDEILYSKIRITVPTLLSGEDAIITSSNGNTMTVELHEPITDVIVPGMEKYTVQAGFTTEDISVGYGEFKKVEGYYVKIVPWSTGTDAEIEAMIQADRDGKINLQDYWNVGDTREVNLSAITSVLNQPAQKAHLTLVHKGGIRKNDTNKTSVRFVVAQTTVLSGKSPSTGVSTNSWNGCFDDTISSVYTAYSNCRWLSSYKPSRKYIADQYYNALPEYIRKFIPTVRLRCVDRYSSTDDTVYTCKTSALDLIELGIRSDSGSYTEDPIFRFDYFATASNRILKKYSGNTVTNLASNENVVTRSGVSSTDSYTSGSTTYYYAYEYTLGGNGTSTTTRYNTVYIAPFFCI